MKNALLVIDVQESFRQRPLWKAISNPQIADTVATLVDATRQAGDLVVWIIHEQPGDGSVFDPALGHCTLFEGLNAQEGEPVLRKTSHNAFTTTNLESILRDEGIETIAVCGIRTEQCCETTARIGSDLGFTVEFITDATATNPIPHRDAAPDQMIDEMLSDPRTLTSAAIIERTEYALAGRFAKIMTADQYTAARNPIK